MSIAMWCLVIASLMPFAAVYPAKADPELDNRDPRARHAEQSGFRRRAYAAHQNCWEAFLLFGVAVIVAEMNGGPQPAINALAIVFIVVRIAYVLSYLKGMNLIRSGLWSAGWLLAMAIFLSPVWG
ncbi:MAPEG family protein [Amorphus orientalis]|uniref:MAPEG superfamily protein n=1 Tax=Amorphus orientalis TaxID=649198 RepID=A0AAE3VNA1_9HYPH|nr:MAPEG family protein [Amorphus orientalis]MDQ0315203.1 putative MAPEG superfamily protein [Amorphus orientalis]